MEQFQYLGKVAANQNHIHEKNRRRFSLGKYFIFLSPINKLKCINAHIQFYLLSTLCSELDCDTAVSIVAG